MENIRRVLVICGIVGDCSGIVHYAAAVASRMNAELFIMTVIYNPFGVKGLSFPRPSLQRDLDALVEKIGKDMQMIIRRERQQGVSIRHIIREGKPEKEIISTVEERKIDLLILPAHRQTRLEHFLAGDGNKTLLRLMPCSVLFFKQEPTAIEEEVDQEELEEKWGKMSATG